MTDGKFVSLPEQGLVPKQEYAVMIGRFQPFHNGHADMLNTALKVADKVVVVLGSARAARNVKNPFTENERNEMIYFHGRNLGIDRERLIVTAVRDHFYSDNMWVTELQERVRQATNNSKRVALVGHYKDESSYYLNLFPGWQFIAHRPRHFDLNNKVLGATEVRAEFFSGFGKDIWPRYVPDATADFLRFFETKPEYALLKETYEYLRDYPKQWGDGPFITADAICTIRGHVLVIERGRIPGKGLLALPGGFVDKNERIIDAAVRELREETSLTLYSPDELKRTIVASDVFDHPARSERGRTVTHGFHFDLERLPEVYNLPTVRGGDDASKAYWLPLYDAMARENEFYEDHLHIIRRFVTRA